MHLPRDRAVRSAILVLFFLSGACGLVYEVVWMRMLTLVFGATAFAAAAILSSFFAGLALGSLLFGRMADRSRNPLALYALLEVGVGAFAFLMPVLFAGVTQVYVWGAQALDLAYVPLIAVRLVLSFLVLLLPTTLMGGTLPVVVRYFVRREDQVGFRVGQLYAVNTFGAVVGTLAAGFFLILFVGVRESAYLAGAFNLLIAGVVWLLSRRVGEGAAPEGGADDAAGASVAPASSVGQDAGSHPQPLSPGRVRLAVWAVGISGLCALAIEVLWTRSLVYFLDNSTHAFTTMLTAFLVGIAVGSALIARFLDGREGLLARLGLIEGLIGVTALMAIPILAGTTPVMERLMAVEPNPWLPWKWIGMRFVTSLTVMLVPTLLMGMTVPLVARIATQHASGAGTTLGRVYSVNTFGGVVGSALAGFVLIPLVGVQPGIALVAGVSVVLGAVLVLADPVVGSRPAVRGAVAVGVVGMGALVWAVTGDGMVLSSYRERVDGGHVLSYREGVGSTVKVFQNPQGEKFVSIDGFPVAGTSFGLYDAQKALGNIPMLLSRVPGARVNLIGFGAGGASWAVLQYGASQVDVVELVPAVLDAAKWFPEVNHGVVDEPRFRAIREDGRNYALIARDRYDVIAVDATSPKMAGNGSLYTQEFYRLLRDRLTDEGMVVQWLPFHLLSDAEMRMTARTFTTVFPHSTVWLSPIRHHALLVGTLDSLRIDLDDLAAKLALPGVREELEPMGVREAMDVVSWFIMGEDGLRKYTEGALLNTDDHPYLEFTPAMSYFYTMQYVTENLYALGMARESPWPYLADSFDSEEDAEEAKEAVDARLMANQHTISGDVFYYLGMNERAQGEYSMALLIDPAEKNWLHPVWHGETNPTDGRWWW